MKINDTVLPGLLLILYSMTGLSADDTVIQALQTDGHIALMRHAIAPGNGDPIHFTIEDCSTQRNLSAQGRTQAQKTGNYLRENGIEKLAVFTSQWCRCSETARLLDYGPVRELSLLNSFYAQRQLEPAQTSQLKQWLLNRSALSPAILVTHQVNITALTGIYPDSGEIVVLKITGDSFQVVGSLER